MRISNQHYVAGLVILLCAPLSALAAQDVAAATSTDNSCTTEVKKDQGNRHYCAARTLWFTGSYAKAESELLRAARIGNAPAQHALGVAYFNGDGLAVDRPLGLAWLALASLTERDDYLGVFKSAYDNSSAEERAQANKQLDRLQRLYAHANSFSPDDACNRLPRKSQPTGCSISGSVTFIESWGPAPSPTAMAGR